MKKVLFVIALFVLTVCSGFVSAYEAEVYKRLGADAPGYYLRHGAPGNVYYFTFGVKQDGVGNRYDAQIATPHTDYEHFQIGRIDVQAIADYILCCDLLWVWLDPLNGPRVPKNWYESAYGDYFSAYINKTDNVYRVDTNPYMIKYSPHDWIITFKDDKGNIVAQDVLTGELYDYFYERSFDEGNYFSRVEFSVTNATGIDPMYSYEIGLSDIRATAVPEPSSLLALAFGGAGTALALRRRK